MKSCWICGDPATTDEHLIKRTDLKQALAKPTANKPLNLTTNTEKNIKIQGLKSRALTIQKILCAKCNNELSQPYDRAWETLSGAIHNRSPTITPNSTMRANKVFRQNSNEQMKNVQLFFVKIFGCIIESEQIPIDTKPFAVSLQSKSLNPNIYLQFGCFPPAKQIVGIRDMDTINASKDGKIVRASWFYGVGRFAVCVIYSSMGTPWPPEHGGWDPQNPKGRLRFFEFL